MGARTSRDAGCLPSSVFQQAVLAKKPKTEVASDAGSPVCDIVEAPAVATKGDEAEYLDVLARCAELRRTKQDLLQVKLQVRSTIDQFVAAFDAEGSERSESCLGEAVAEAGQDDETCDLQEKEVDPLSYEEALAEEEELDAEVEMLRESLDTASAMVAAIVQKSQQWSEHLEQLEKRSQPLTELPTKACSNAASETSLDDILALSLSGNCKQDRMKLPSLKLEAAGVAGSEASSSTATPRSDNDSESRMASARSEKNVVYCEA